MNSEGNDASRSWKLGEGGHDSYWQRAWLDAQTKYKKSKKGISCDEKRKDAKVRERGEKKVNPGKHQAAIDVLISQGVVVSGLGGIAGRSWRLSKSYLDVYGMYASWCRTPLMCWQPWSASGLHRLPH
jgi:hypothetical protein